MMEKRREHMGLPGGKLACYARSYGRRCLRGIIGAEPDGWQRAECSEHDLRLAPGNLAELGHLTPAVNKGVRRRQEVDPAS